MIKEDEDKYKADLAFVKQYLFLNYEKYRDIDAFLRKWAKGEKLYRKPINVKKDFEELRPKKKKNMKESPEIIFNLSKKLKKL